MELTAFLSLTEELNSPELTETRKTQILMELQADYKEQTDSIASLNENSVKQTERINDLTHAHAIMFRKVGGELTGTQAQQKELEHSEKITLENIEGGF